MADNKSRINESTTVNFDGFVAVTNPQESWVARWCRVEKLFGGCYAVKVHGEVSQEVEGLIDEYQVRNIGKLSQKDH